MKKGLKCSLIVMVAIIMCIALNACGKSGNRDNLKEVDKRFRQIKDDEIVVCLDDYDLFFPSLGGITERRLRIPILAGEKVNTDDIKVEVEGAGYTTSIYEEEITELEYYTFLSYTDMDLKKCADLYVNDSTKYKEYDDKYIKEYEKLDLKTFPKYKFYSLDIIFDNDGGINDIDISEVIVKYKDKKYNIKGTIAFRGDVLPHTNFDIFEDYGLAFDEITFVPSKEGKYYFDEINLKSEKDFEILDVYTVEQSVLKVTKTNVLIGGDNAIDRELTSGQTIKVSAGSEVKLNLELSKDSKGAFTYTSNPIILIKYRVDGKEFIANANVIARTILDSSQLYAKYIDKKDIQEYYDTLYKVYKNR